MTTNIAVGTDGKGRKFTIDIEDWVKCKDYYWWVDVSAGNRCEALINKQCVLLHRFLMNPPKEMQVDHINGDPTDNRKSNLRIVTAQQNGMNKKQSVKNTSGHTGVYWDKDSSRWEALITYKRKSIHLGRFVNKEDAIKARQEAEKKYFGEYRRKMNNER